MEGVKAVVLIALVGGVLPVEGIAIDKFLSILTTSVHNYHEPLAHKLSVYLPQKPYSGYQDHRHDNADKNHRDETQHENKDALAALDYLAPVANLIPRNKRSLVLSHLKPLAFAKKNKLLKVVIPTLTASALQRIYSPPRGDQHGATYHKGYTVDALSLIRTLSGLLTNIKKQFSTFNIDIKLPKVTKTRPAEGTTEPFVHTTEPYDPPVSTDRPHIKPDEPYIAPSQTYGAPPLTPWDVYGVPPKEVIPSFHISADTYSIPSASHSSSSSSASVYIHHPPPPRPLTVHHLPPATSYGLPTPSTVYQPPPIHSYSESHASTSASADSSYTISNN